jgi:RHS repeat-associated protein
MPDGPSIAADELVSQAVGGTTTSFAYDAWGRMTSKSDGTYSATYAYRYGDKLASVMSDFPSEGNASYQYDGAGKRRQRTGGGTTTRYRWDMGWNVLNEEDNLGALTRTYVGRSAAHVDGSDPSTGTWRFYVHDHLGSTRGVYNSDKTPYAGLEHTPYGELYACSGSISDITRRYTGHDWDDAAELYYAPYRCYAPGLARWITRDPLGMVDGANVYAYVGLSPTGRIDQMGLDWGDVGKWTLLRMLVPLVGLIESLRAINCLWTAFELGDAEQAYNRKHCVAGCELQKCMGGTILPQAVWQLNLYYELLWWGTDYWDPEDVRRDNWAAEYGAAEAWDDPCVDCGKACSVWP